MILTLPPVFRTRSVFRLGAALVLGASLAGCGLPEADGTEAAIAAKVEKLPALAPVQGSNANSLVRNGLLMDPAVREAASLVSASADEIRVQRAALFPSLGISLGGGFGGGGSGDPALEISGRQLVLDYGDTKRAVTVADFDMQINYFSFQKAVDAALVELLKTYNAVSTNSQLLEVRRKQLSAMKELEGLVAKQEATGAVPSSDILETRKQLQSAEFLAHDAELALAESRDRLMRLAGQSQGGNIPKLGSSCKAPGATDDVSMAKLRHARAVIELERAERARLPRAYISPLARGEVGEGVSVGLNVGVDADVLQGGAHAARANAARKRLEGARAGVQAAERDLYLDERSSQRELAAGSRKTEILDRQIDLLAETRDLFRSQYFDLGIRQVSELLDNEEEYYDRQAEKIEVQADLNRVRLECAARDRSLRRALGLDRSSLYGLPLDPDAL